MRSVFLTLLVCASVLATQTARAADADRDRVFVATYYFEVMHIERAPHVSGLAYVRALRHRLEPHSIYVLDEDALARALPRALTDGVSNMFKNVLYHRCFAPLEDWQTARLVAFIKTRADGAEPFPDDHFEQFVRMCIRDIRWGWPRRNAVKTLDAIMDMHAYHPQVAEILQLPGIAKFPNRVARSNVLTYLR